ncbi:MAG TPA: hypothetical protein VLG76_04725, partial [Rhabdochlamydiaceae bacterium]|nr:hypothetical protein [Rhabdochlamydiaceae bacterium]
LFDKVPIICAQDTRCRDIGEKNDVYGYSRLVTPDNYEEIYFDHGSGTTVWIKQEEKYKTLSEALKNQGIEP